jgi:hypothetical protein
MAKIKSFAEFCESLLVEAPEIYNVEQTYQDRFTNNIRNSNSSEVGLIRDGRDMILYHGTKENPHSMSDFRPTSSGTLYTHANTAKGVGGSKDNIISNIVKVGSKTPVISDESNSKGAISLWRGVSEKHPDHTHVVKYNPMTSGYDVVGKLKDIHNDDVWGEGKGNIRLLFDGTGNPPAAWYKR